MPLIPRQPKLNNRSHPWRNPRNWPYMNPVTKEFYPVIDGHMIRPSLEERDKLWEQASKKAGSIVVEAETNKADPEQTIHDEQTEGPRLQKLYCTV